MVCFVLIMAMTVVAFCSVGQAQGSKQEDSSTLGLGSSRAQAADTQQLSSAQRASGVADASSSVDGVTVTEAADATEATQRSITVKDPDPVVVPIAVDETNALAKQKANEVCTLDPLPTAPRVAPAHARRAGKRGAPGRMHESVDEHAGAGQRGHPPGH